MKKILWLSILFSFIFASHTFAAPVLTVPVPTSNVITATLTGASNTNTFQLQVQTTAFSNAPAPTTSPKFSTTDPSIQTPNAQGVVHWSLTEAVNTTYYVRVLQISLIGNAPSYVGAVQKVTTGKSAVAPLQFDFLTSSLQGSNIRVQGQVLTTQPNYTDYTDYLSYSTSPTVSNPINGGLIPGTKDPTTTGLSYWLIPTTPNTTYYAQETYKGDGQTIVDPHIISFDGGTGTSIAGSAANGVFTPGAGAAGTASTNLNPNYYKLLSGFPGFTVLPDPTLCAQERAANKAPQFCDINDVLNYFMKLLIGVSGVFLVFRLMYEGYVIMTTDVPWLKASSKNAFFTALLGLLLALGAYLILNTINPKLVDESVGLQQLSIGVDQGDTNAPTTFLPAGQIPKGIYCPNSGKTTAIAQIAQSFKGHVTYSQALPKGAIGSDGFISQDCSGYANTVLKCAGYVPGKDFINDGTASIFAGSENVNMSSGFSISGSDVFINNKKLNPGDVVGWTPSSDSRGNGHAIIYIGNATFMDSHGGTSGRQPGNAIGVYSASQLQSHYSTNIKSVERMPM